MEENNVAIEFSKHWLKEFAAEHGFNYESLMDFAEQWQNDDHDIRISLSSGTSDSYAKEWGLEEKDRLYFWKHYQIVTGKTVNPEAMAGRGCVGCLIVLSLLNL